MTQVRANGLWPWRAYAYWDERGEWLMSMGYGHQGVLWFSVEEAS